MVKISLENGISINIDTRDNINSRSQEGVGGIILGILNQQIMKIILNLLLNQ